MTAETTTTDQEPPRAVIYTRFSPRRNADQCESAEIQEAYCEQDAHNKGYIVISRYSDKSLSGSAENRPGLWGAVEALPKGGVLLVYKRDRLARNVYLEECIKRAVEARGGRIEAVQGDVSGDGPEQEMIRQILSCISEYERKIIGIRTKWAMLDKQRRGQRMGRYAPYGYMIDPEDKNMVIPNETEQEALNEIQKLWGTMTPGAIRTHMNKEFRHLCRGQRWEYTTVKKIGERYERQMKADGVDFQPEGSL